MNHALDPLRHVDGQAHHLRRKSAIFSLDLIEYFSLPTAISTASSSTLIEEYLKCSALASATEAATISARAGLESSPKAIAYRSGKLPGPVVLAKEDEVPHLVGGTVLEGSQGLGDWIESTRRK